LILLKKLKSENMKLFYLLLFLPLFLLLTSCKKTMCIQGFPNGVIIRESWDHDEDLDLFWVKNAEGLFIVYVPQDFDLSYILSVGDTIKCPCYSCAHTATFQIKKDLVDTVSSVPVIIKKE
jgi:hypothetical protein